MESLSAERDCGTLVRWWEGGGSAWDWIGGGEGKCGSLDIPRLAKTLQRQAEFTAAEILRREEGSEKGDRNKKENNGLMTERTELWKMRRGR